MIYSWMGLKTTYINYNQSTTVFINQNLCYRYKMDSGQIDQQLVQDIEVNWSFNECEKLVFVVNRVITLD